VTRLGSRDRAGIDALVERTLAHARMARDPSITDKERVLTSLRGYLDDPTGALRDSLDDPAGEDAAGEDAAGEDAVSGVRQIVQEAARPAASSLPRSALSGSAPSGSGGSWSARSWAANSWGTLPASVQKLMWVGAVTGGLGFWLGSQPNPTASSNAASEVGPSRPAAGEGASEPSALPILPITPVPSQAPSVRPQPAPAEAPSTAASPTAAPSTAGLSKAAPLVALPVVVAPPPAASQPEPRRTAAPLNPSVQVSPALLPQTALPQTALPQTALPQPARSSEAAKPPAAASPAVPSPALPPPPFVGSGSPPLGAANPPAPSAPSVRDPRFLEAVRLVQRAQRAVESGAPSTALTLLDDLDARFPAAMLNEERLATRVLALCASGAVARAKRVAAELGVRNPSSIYAARIAQSCAGSAASSPVVPPAPRR
jgi:hypothetical protein